ncbi:DUF707 domain-containing protein [Acinetobacter guerrae]|uniref:DUF707 domain-containing protein n=1 Tax=Acinetobacter guerrae TaxID=1843371 RepID=UPI00125F8F95|nr:DUF707 domain-containing protein [Acinetobacter guerrae]MPW43620.1 hypothetical protein [Acinetobacter guerrae]
MKNLIVVRCGDNSLHEKWISNEAHYDVALSYFGDHPKFDMDKVKFFHPYKGSKWEGLYHFFSSTEFWKEYDAIWLPDDDIDTDVQTINDFFELFHYYKFDLAQPSLDERSYYSWSILLNNKSFKYRETNFVEVMIPCFNQKSFEFLYATFNENKSGWGLDNLWPKRLGNSAKIGIIDEVKVFHTRPVGAAGNGVGKQDPRKKSFFSKPKIVTPLDELNDVLKKYDLSQETICIGGLDQQNTYLKAENVEFIKKIIVGADNRLLEEISVSFGLDKIGLVK